MLLLTLLVLSAEARRETYCVGGYTGTPPRDITSTACNTPEVASLHRRWHHHNFFVKDGTCYDCWDEHDSSCQTAFARQHPEYETVRAPECPPQDNTSELIKHVIVGMPADDVTWDLSGPVDSAVTLGPSERPPTAGEPATLVGTTTDQGGVTVPAKGHFEVTTEDGQVTRVKGERQDDGTVTATHPLPEGEVSVRFVPQLPVQPPEVRDHGLDISVRPQASLGELAAIDFGTVPAGAPHTAACRTLDLSGATLPAGIAWTVSATGLEGCTAQPVVPRGDALGFLAEGPVELPLSTSDGLTVCLAAAWCDGDSANDDTALRLVPADPRYPDVAVAVPLRWSVTGRGWLACNGIWLWPVLGGLGLVFVVAGFVRPSRFPTDATAKMAGSEKGLKRAVPTRLRDVPGSAAGFYRDARLGLLAEGSLSRSTRGAVAILRATRDGVRVEPRAAIERLDRRNRSWVPAELEGGSLQPGPRDIFRAGDLYFQLEVD